MHIRRFGLIALAIMSVVSSGTASAAAAPAAGVGSPGTVLRRSALTATAPGALPAAARAYRVTYASTGWNSAPDVVTGAVYVPHGTPPKGGWPVISWAHGTTGIADACAPTIAGRSDSDTTFLSSWLNAGYAVVATDYQGLGSPGAHPYLDGRSLAYSTIDMVRAGRRADRSLSRHWLSLGWSEGGLDALWTGSLASTYAPELDYRGTMATAPASQAHQTLSAIPISPTTPMNAFWFYFMAGFQTTIPKFDPARYLTPRGLALYRTVFTSASACHPQLQTSITASGLTYGDLTTLTAAKVNELADDLSSIGEIPIGRYSKPVFIAQGTADTTVYPPSTKTTADQLTAAGSTVTLKWYQGATHAEINADSLPDLLDFARARFADH